MGRMNSPPFARGNTFYAGRTIDSSNLQGVEQEGHEFLFEDNNWNATGAPPLSGYDVLCVILRNSTGGAILPGQTIALDPTNPGHALSIPAALAARHVVIADEFLPAAGAPANDLFWGVFQGPTTAISDGTITSGSIVISSATSGEVANGTIATIAQLEAHFAKAMATQAVAGSLVRIFMHPEW